MGAVLEFATRLETLTCGECGIQFAVPEAWIVRKRRGEEPDRGFHCPAGHSRTFTGETEAERLQRELDAQKRTTKWTEERLESVRKERDHQEQRARALRGVVTKVKKRVGHGVCPCCNRTFQQLASHMKKKHPEYANGEVAP